MRSTKTNQRVADVSQVTVTEHGARIRPADWLLWEIKEHPKNHCCCASSRDPVNHNPQTINYLPKGIVPSWCVVDGDGSTPIIRRRL